MNPKKDSSAAILSVQMINTPDLCNLILNAIPDAIHIIDQDLRILACNDAMNRFLQFSGYEGEIIGKTLPEAFPFLRSSIIGIYENIFSSGAGSEEEEPAWKKDERIVIETTRIPIISDEKVAYVVTVIHDITKRIRIQREITRRSRILEAVNSIISISARTNSENELCADALEQVMKLLEFDAGGIYQYHPQTRTSTLLCHNNLPEGFYEEVHRYEFDSSPVSSAIIRGEGVFSDDYGAINPDRATRYGIHALACIPIMKKTGLAGVLNIISFHDYHFTEEDRELLRAIGIELGNALDSLETKRELIIQQQNTTNLVDSLWDMILILSRDGTIIGANRASAMVLGYEPTQIEGMNLQDIISDQSIRSRMVDPGRHGSSRVFKARLRHLNGHLVETEIVISNGRWDRDPVSIAVIRDRTLIAQAEERLKESEERHRILLERLPDYILVIRDGSILYLNPAASELMVPSTENPESIFSYIIPEFHNVVRSTLARLNQNEQTGPFEIKILINSRIRTVLVNAVSIRYGDKPADLVVLTDITERKQIESEMMNRARVSGIISRIISAIHQAETLKAIHSQVLDTILTETGIKSGVLFLTDKTGKTAEFTHACGVPTTLLSRIKTILIPLKPITMSTLEGDLSRVLFTDLYPGLDLPTGISSVYPVPLLSGMEVSGELHLYLSRDQDTDTVLPEILPSIGRELGAAIARIRAQEELKGSEANLQTLFQSITDMVFVIRTDGQITAINDAVRISLGLSEEMLVGANMNVLPDKGEICIHSLEELISSDQCCGKIVLTRTDGTTLTGEVRITSGIWNGVDVRFCVVRDISEQVYIEMALRQSEERFRAIFEQASIGMVLTDASYHIIQTNEYFQQMIGYQAPELFGRHISDLTLPEDYEKELSLVSALTGKETTGNISLEKRYIHKNGSIIWSLIRMIALTGEKGEIIGVIGAVLDITREKKADDALKSALTKLNLLSSITRHDILNQLTGVIGYNEIISMMINDANISQYLEKQRKAAETIKHQIEFTRYYEDLGVNEPGWFVIDELVARAVSRLDLKGIRITTKTDSHAIYADPLIETVIYNLIDNAIRYSEKGSTILVTAIPEEGGSNLIVAFTDDGVGVSYADKDKIFKRGFGKNTGFGLFLAREVLNITGMTIRETGIPGNGARFEIIIPEGMYQ